MSPDHQSLETSFERFLESTGLVRRGESIVVAVSGGIDSMVLLHLLNDLRTRWELRLAVAHVNHQLREEESMEDERFVRAEVKSLGMDCFSKRVDTLGHMLATHLSKQEAARQLRYEFFEEVRQKLSAKAVATAHQADDNAETVLLNALRGTGVRGLAGIPLQRESGSIIRPLLFARRKEIEAYAVAHQISFRLDSSNESDHYKRNYLRRNVIPLLESSGEFDFVPSLTRLSRVMRQLDDLLSTEARQIMNSLLSMDQAGECSLNIARLRSKPDYLQEGIILEVLRRLGAEIESEKILRILELCELTTGSQVQLSKDLSVYRNRDRLQFVRPRVDPDLHMMVALGRSYTVDEYTVSLSLPLPRPSSLNSTKEIEFVDAGRLGEKLLLRTWQDGDWFIPLGLNARKKISDFFVDEKVSLLQKRRIPILVSNGEIVWVCGRRLDERFKVTDNTQRVVKLEIGTTINSH